MRQPQGEKKIVPIPPQPRYNAAREREHNVIGQRIAEGRRRKGCSQSDFRLQLIAHGVCVGIGAISKWERGDSAPNAYQLLAIWQVLEEDITFFMDATPRSELNAAGLRKLAEYRSDLIATGLYAPAPAAPETRYREMPVSRLPVSAGSGAFLDEENIEMLPFPADSIPEGAEFGLRVSGDSMEPVYHDGQIVWVQLCKNLAVGDVGIFVYDGEGYLKAYDEQEPSPDQAELFTDSSGFVRRQPVMLSYNRRYPPRIISPNLRFQIIGRVLG